MPTVPWYWNAAERVAVGPGIACFGAGNKYAHGGLPALMALCSGLLEKSVKGGLILVGALNLGGSVEPLANAVGIVEVAVEKGASVVLMPVSARRQLFELTDDMATRINVLFYSDTPDALLKALLE